MKAVVVRRFLTTNWRSIKPSPRNIDHADAGCETAWWRSSATSKPTSTDTEPANGPTECGASESVHACCSDRDGVLAASNKRDSLVGGAFLPWPKRRLYDSDDVLGADAAGVRRSPPGANRTVR